MKYIINHGYIYFKTDVPQTFETVIGNIKLILTIFDLYVFI